MQNEEASLPKKKYLDELEMQQSSFVDKKGRHVPTVIEKNSLINGEVTTNPTKLTDEAKPIKGVDMSRDDCLLVDRRPLMSSDWLNAPIPQFPLLLPSRDALREKCPYSFHFKWSSFFQHKC
uniref:Prolactin receptor n=1 Tax=Romanomermis culicivorax TaxID=13658 RepID=A0A915KEZ9_ROMCU